MKKPIYYVQTVRSGTIKTRLKFNRKNEALQVFKLLRRKLFEKACVEAAKYAKNGKSPRLVTWKVELTSQVTAGFNGEAPALCHNSVSLRTFPFTSL